MFLMTRLRLLILGVVILGSVFASVSYTPAHAFDPLEEVCSQATTGATDANGKPLSAADSPTCIDKGDAADPITGKDGLILRISTILASVAGVLAVIMIIIAAANMISSGGDANKVKESRSKIMHALIGLIIIVFAQIIVALVVTKLL